MLTFTPFLKIFQLAASRRGWPSFNLDSLVLSYFNSQPHEEADAALLFFALIKFCISTRSLTRRLTILYRIYTLTLRYFNSQPHEEADVSDILKLYETSIFQLAASRGGWLDAMPCHAVTSVFQLAASRGGWPFLSPPWLHWMIFQLAASRGGWPFYQIFKLHCCSISTRSLTRRLTAIGCSTLPILLFQLAASRGGWPNAIMEIVPLLHFNSQPHEEADQVLLQPLFCYLYFNSQPHEEADTVHSFSENCW